MNHMSQEENLFHNEYTSHRQDGNQRSRDTISVKTGTVCLPLETKYDDINDIVHTRCVTFTDPFNVYDKANYPASDRNLEI